MKASAIIELPSGTFRFKIKYSTLCDLRELGVDLLSEKGSKALEEDPTKLRIVFWKGLEGGEMRSYTQDEAYDIFDDVMEHLGPEEFAAIIPKALAVKSAPPVKN